MHTLLQAIVARLMKPLTRRGVLVEEVGRVETLDAHLVGLTKTVDTVEQRLSVMPQPVGKVRKLSAELTGTLGAVAQVLESISTEAQYVAGSTAPPT